MRRLLRGEILSITALVLLALIVRVAVVAAQFDQLGVDRDGYREIAFHLARGEGFAHTVDGAVRPTAYRPPLYPVVLAVNFGLGAGDAGLGLLHVLLGTATVWLTWRTGTRLGLGRWSLLAAACIAVDPLLVKYTALPMTETLCTFLVALLLLLLTGVLSAREEAVRHSRRRWLLIGAVFGLGLLCRPTLAAFGLLAGACWTGHALWTRRRLPLFAWPALLAAAVVISPWVTRNVLVLGRPIVTTTHGGYTLLLGNNPVFYHEVVARPWGRVWQNAPQDRTQAAWLSEVEADLRRDLGPLADNEPARDEWMNRRALDNMAAEPGLFVRSGLLRLARFWNVVPLAPARRGVPPLIVWGVGLFYGAQFAAFLLGCAIVLRQQCREWLPLLLMIASFTLVHQLYWANMRMRAPVLPAIALIAAAGVSWLACRRGGRRHSIWST